VRNVWYDRINLLSRGLSLFLDYEIKHSTLRRRILQHRWRDSFVSSIFFNSHRAQKYIPSELWDWSLNTRKGSTIIHSCLCWTFVNISRDWLCGFGLPASILFVRAFAGLVLEASGQLYSHRKLVYATEYVKSSWLLTNEERRFLSRGTRSLRHTTVPQNDTRTDITSFISSSGSLVIGDSFGKVVLHIRQTSDHDDPPLTLSCLTDFLTLFTSSHRTNDFRDSDQMT